MNETVRFRVGIDVGGTFTDFVLADLASGGLTNHKEPSTPADPPVAASSPTWCRAWTWAPS